MEKVTGTSSRKADHIKINLEEDVQSNLTTGLENFYFMHEALPEINLDQVDTSINIFGKQLSAPMLISSMTGGTEKAREINLALAQAAQKANIAVGVGSQRAAIEDPQLENTFKIRQAAPDILLFANLGAVQLNYGYGIDQAQKAVDMIEADALILHLNALQEAVQPEGDTRFSGLLQKIEQICKKLPVPVIAKEVGWGFSGNTARRLFDAGVRAIDVAGAGGTSWTQVEMHRATSESQARLAQNFINWGIPTAESLKMVKEVTPSNALVFASGGLRSGLDAAKCIALGASLTGMAGPYLKAANISSEAVYDTILEIKQQLIVCMFAAGIKNIQQLQETKLIIRE
jgi:isopentenyl-diphosphate delta-isomerase